MSAVRIARGMRLETSIVRPLSTEEIAQYSAVSGDDNPIHIDRQLASSLGLEDIPVQGMFLKALMNSYIEDWRHCSGVRKLSTRFVAPAFANEGVEISGKVMVPNPQSQTAIVRILVHQADRLVAMADADVAISGD